MENPPKILAVDDHPVVLKGITALLESAGFEVYAANDADQANALMCDEKLRFKCALLDIQLDEDISGMDLAEQYRKIDPHMAIIILTADPEAFPKHIVGRVAIGNIVDDCVDKSVCRRTLLESVNCAIWKRARPHHIRQRIFRTLKDLLPCQKDLIFRSRTGDGEGAEKIEAECKDGERLAFVVYNIPESELAKRNVISICSSIGCIGKCKFCLSKSRPFKRPLSTNELIAEVLYGLDSYHAKGLWEGRKRMVVNFTAEGDAVCSNLDNACEVIGRLSQIKEIGLDFIITTIGNVENLKRFLSLYSELPVTFYWSVNFLDEVQRAEYMPTTINQSLHKQKDLFEEISEKTRRKVTASWVLITGVNDSQEHVRQLVDFFQGRPFEIKVMGLEEDSLDGIPKTPNEEVARFVQLLKEAGLPARQRQIVGGKYRAGCGKTIPD